MGEHAMTGPQAAEELLALRQQVANLQQAADENRRRAEQFDTEQQLANAELRKSDEKLRLLAEHIQTVFWLLDANGSNMLYVSPAYEKLWGRTCQSLYDNSLSFLEATHPDDREMARDIFQRQMQEGQRRGNTVCCFPMARFTGPGSEAIRYGTQRGRSLGMSGFAKTLPNAKRMNKPAPGWRPLSSLRKMPS